MERTRSYLVLVALFAGLAATVALPSCATKPSAAPAASPPSAAAAPKPVSPAAPASQSVAPALPPPPLVPGPPAVPAAKKAEPQTAVAATADEKPELSLPRRSPLPVNVIIAAMDEPRLPAPARPIPALPAMPATAPQIPPPKSEAPLAAPAASSPPAVAKTAPETAKPRALPKPANKLPEAEPEPEPKNAASDDAIAVNPLASAQSAISRTIAAVEGTRFEVPFEGTGWTYLGEKSLKEGIAYDSRRFVSNSLVFVLNPIKAGDYFLRFQRQDSLRGLSYEDLVEVVVSPKPEPSATSAVGTQSRPSAAGPANGPVAASATPVASVPSPSSLGTPPMASSPQAPTGGSVAATAVPAVAPTNAVAPIAVAAPATGSVEAGAPTNGSVPALPVSSLTSPESALAQARSALAAGQAQGALDALDRLMTLAPAGTDEAFFLYGQALELNGPTKDIKRAYAYYEKIRDEYPESAFWDRANDRVSYIERHYFDIR